MESQKQLFICMYHRIHFSHCKGLSEGSGDYIIYDPQPRCGFKTDPKNMFRIITEQIT